MKQRNFIIVLCRSADADAGLIRALLIFPLANLNVLKKASVEAVIELMIVNNKLINWRFTVHCRLPPSEKISP